MALAALDLQVPTLERKISLSVIERFLVERGKIAVAAFMFGMTSPALAVFDIFDPAMRTGFLGDVLVNILMALQAQLVLPVGFKVLVALVALFFITRVRFGEVAGTQQRFNCFFGAGAHVQRKCRADQKQQRAP